MNETAEAIRQLLQKEQFAALSTAKEDKPYINLVAFSGTDDLSLIIFCTPRKTRKYENLQHNPRVALLVENSRNQAVDLTQAMALTAIGRAVFTTAVQDPESANRFLDKHPHMKQFVYDSATVLVRVCVEKYVLVKNFQDTLIYTIE